MLGHDVRGRAVVIEDQRLAAHALLVGASGSGKSTTMLTLLGDRIARSHPVVAIDMKGSPAFARELAAVSAAAGRALRVWTPNGPSQWNPLAHGSPTALKDKLISAERFSEPHYKRAAERYLQFALRVLQETGAGGTDSPVTLRDVVAMTEPAALAARLASAPPALARDGHAYLEGLTPDQLSAARGIGTRLAVLHESDAGRWLGADAGSSAAPQLDLATALTGGDVVLLSINSSVYGELGAQLGALAIQDLTSAAGERLRGAGRLAPATVAIDEFSALGADNVLSLLARGREAGVGVLLATQELADLERAGRGFRDQVLGITAVTIAHRQEVHDSATAISHLAGTRTVWRATENLPAHPLARLGLGAGGRAPLSRGTRRLSEEPVVHPNTIKRLETGQAVVFASGREPTAVAVSRRTGGRVGGRDGRQAAPGVTR
jgi:type IV secretory pathway TraG/TraD family ATPase VirD4